MIEKCICGKDGYTESTEAQKAIYKIRQEDLEGRRFHYSVYQCGQSLLYHIGQSQKHSHYVRAGKIIFYLCQDEKFRNYYKSLSRQDRTTVKKDIADIIRSGEWAKCILDLRDTQGAEKIPPQTP